MRVVRLPSAHICLACQSCPATTGKTGVNAQLPDVHRHQPLSYNQALVNVRKENYKCEILTFMTSFQEEGIVKTYDVRPCRRGWKRLLIAAARQQASMASAEIRGACTKFIAIP